MRIRRTLLRRERGFGMLEVGLALVVVAFAAAGLSKMLTSNVAATKAKSNAERLVMVTLAADQYLIQNEQQLKTVLPAGGAPIAIPVGKTCATCPVPNGPSGLPSVQGDGLLSTAYVDLNNDQQSHALIVKELASGDLDAIITTYGGSPINDENLGYITGLIGAAAGGVYTNAAIAPTTQISGAHGGWGDATASWNASIGGTNVRPSSGHVQVAMSLAKASGMGAIDPDDVLFRTNNGNDTRNTMATDLRMGGYNVRGATEVRAQLFRDDTPGDSNYWVNPGGTSQISQLWALNDGEFGPFGAATVRIMPNRAVNTALFQVGNTAGNQVAIRGNGQMLVDNFLQVGDTAGNLVRLYDNGNLRADDDIYSGGSIEATNDLRGKIFKDTTPGSEGYEVNPGGGTIIRNLRVGVLGNTGNDVFINDNGDIEADGSITGGNMYAAAYRDTSEPGTSYILNPSSETRIERLVVGDDPATGSPNVGNNVVIDHGNVTADEDVTAVRNMYALAWYDTTNADGYNVNPSHTSALNQVRVGVRGNTANDIILRNDGTIHMDGDITALAYYYTSDERLKENIQDLDGWEVLKDLSPKSYRYKKDGREAMGLIAQDVEKILPHLVQEDEDGMKSVNYMDLIGPLVGVAQELYAKVELLEEEMREMNN